MERNSGIKDFGPQGVEVNLPRGMATFAFMLGREMLVELQVCIGFVSSLGVSTAEVE